MTLTGAGDHLLMTNPLYFNHESTLSMLGVGVRTVDVDPTNGFLPDPDAIRAALPGAKALALVSPNNPTGAVYPPALLEAIFEACREAGVWLIVDETYRDFTDTRHGLLARDDWREGLVQLYSFSKSFCIPGHRLGAITAGAPVIAAVAKVMDNLQICAPRAAQHAVARAIEPLTEWRAGNRAEIETRAAAMRETMAQAPDWQIAAMGAYFAYIRHPFEGRGSVEVARGLAETVGVSCIPGAFFGTGQERYLRLAFANAGAGVIAGLAGRLHTYR
jgi:aspartate/methionine/tyrosine aminotransferase